jgi:hypothetical protein
VGTPPPRRASKDSLYDITPGVKGSPSGDYFSQSPSPLSGGARRESKGKGVVVRTPSGTKLPSRRSSLNNTDPAAMPYCPPPPTGSRPASRRNSGARPGFPDRSNTGSFQQRTDSGNIVKLKFSDQAKIVTYNFAKGADGFDLPNKWTMTLHIAPDIYLRDVAMTDEVVKWLNEKFPYWNSPSAVPAMQQLRNITRNVRLGVSYLVNDKNEALVANVQSVKRPGPDVAPIMPKSAQGLMEDKLNSIQNSFRQQVNTQKRNILSDSKFGGFLRSKLDLHYKDPYEEQAEQQKRDA